MRATKYSAGICLEFHLREIVTLVAERLLIEEPQTIISYFKPWTSENQILLDCSLKEIPRPEFWEESLNALGHSISFRYYAGEPKATIDVSFPDYQGYYFQLKNRVSSTPEGIFTRFMNILNGRLHIAFEKKDFELEQLWKDISYIVGYLPDVNIRSGNREFSGPQWKLFLEGAA